MEQTNNFKMSIKARVECSNTILHGDTARYNGKTVEIIDFVPTAQGLVAMALVEQESNYIFFPFFLSDLVIDK